MRNVVAAIVVGASVLMALGLRPAEAQEDASKPEFYKAKVQPIFQQNCFKCHAGMFRRGGLNMGTREGMLKGGHHGAALVPGDPSNSLILHLIRHEGKTNDPGAMPPKKPRLSDSDVDVVERWVKAGAVMP